MALQNEKEKQELQEAIKRYKQELEFKNKALEIEAALEQVRAKSMAMKTQEDLLGVIETFGNQLMNVGINFGMVTFIEGPITKTRDWNLWSHTPDAETPTQKIHIPYIDHPFFTKTAEIVENYLKTGQPIHVKIFTKEEKDTFLPHFFKHTPTLSNEAKESLYAVEGETIVDAFLENITVSLAKWDSIPPSEEELKIFERFAKEFKQAYIRYLDIKKAEAQAREAQINLAIERVRARALAMHKSEEILAVVAKLKEEVMGLDINGVVAATIFLEAEDDKVRMWDLSSLERSDHGYLAVTDITFKLKKEDPHLYIKRVWESTDDYYLDVQNKEDLDRIIEFMYEYNQVDVAKEIEEYTKQTNLQTLYHATIKLNKGKLSIDLFEPPPEEMKPILEKIGAAFDLAYKRFEDIKKAEAQAREARIEAALERVRSQSMGMQGSEELSTTTQVFHQQLQLLGIDSEFSYLWLPEEDETHQVFWATWSQHDGDYHTKKVRYPLDKSEASIAACYAAWESDEPVHVNAVKPDGVKDYFETWSELLANVDKFQPRLFADGLYYIDAYMKYGCFGIVIKRLLHEDEKNILNRFSKEFERTYTRFLDLKKAEAQARESQIEAALERVRSHSMGMQSTDDFASVTTEMFNQLRNFGEDLFATGIVFCDKHDGHVEQWHSIPNGGMLSPMIVPIDLDYIHQYRYDQWKAGKELFSIEIPSDFIEQHFEDIFNLPSAQLTLKDLESRNAPMPEPPPWEIDYGASFKHGYILISSLKHFENTDILPRFAKVFEQAYTRFLDLQNAEKNAYKSKVEVALERVRARAMAMQEPDELRDVASVLRTEMGYLGIEELETCSIYILDSKGGEAECWYAIKDDKDEDNKLISDHIAMDFTKTKIGQHMLEFHKTDKETTSIVMKGQQRIEWIRYCEQQSTLLQGFYGEEIPERTYHLQKFSNGAIGAASAGDISEESWSLLKRCASVFSLAYSRFKDLTQAKIDLKRLKVEKKRAEDALSELQTTQKQLIQSEKMASLGELTAGIAHEIQNPLNFVNNFSEVSKELLEEMHEEIENGDFEEVKAIMDDIVQNLEKIHHHGKRADSIVKGMLQHSRSSGNKKEPTDINALADEYLRLAYHGLRAKDQSFNAELVTDFDKNIQPIEVVPQDIGRVILNLLTNAFYVVNKKKQSSVKDYTPIVSITTKEHQHSIQIKVTDNGSGMPESVKDKIFQPFFTTKPTGEGTGLGLSLSYDIITKGHGGDLKVESREGEGTTICIILPL